METVDNAFKVTGIECFSKTAAIVNTMIQPHYLLIFFGGYSSSLPMAVLFTCLPLHGESGTVYRRQC